MALVFKIIQRGSKAAPSPSLPLSVSFPPLLFHPSSVFTIVLRRSSIQICSCQKKPKALCQLSNCNSPKHPVNYILLACVFPSKEAVCNTIPVGPHPLYEYYISLDLRINYLSLHHRWSDRKIREGVVPVNT